MTTRITPIVKTRVVLMQPAAAFHLFTEGMATWWPTITHSIEAERVVDVRVEGRRGGRIVEVAADGTEWVWAEVLAWDPPRRVELSWHPSRTPTAASTIEVLFTPEGSATRITLEHRDWDRFGDDGAALRDRYEDGWEPVLTAFVSAADRPT